MLSLLLACRPALPDAADTAAGTAPDSGAAWDAGPDTGADSGAQRSSREGLLLEEVTYLLTWDTSRIEPLAQGWAVETDLGYRVEIEDGFLVSYALHLEPCAALFHSGSDRSDMPTPRVERLDTFETTLLAPVTFPTQRYCGVAYDLARADWTAEGAPEDLEVDGVTLALEGRWSREGGEPVEFSWSSSLTASNSYPLEVQRPTRRARVELRRDAGALFDGLELADEDPDVLLRDVLINLVLDARTLAF